MLLTALLSAIVVCLAVAALPMPGCLQISKGEFLGYCGAVLGGVITLFGVVATIRFEQGQAEEDRADAVRPLLVPIMVGREELIGFPSELKPDRGCFFILKNDVTAEVRQSLNSKVYKEWLERHVECRDNNGLSFTTCCSTLAVAFMIKNVGRGVATYFLIRVRPSSYQPKEQDIAAGHFVLEVGDGYCAAIVGGIDSCPVDGEYFIDIDYFDMNGNEYRNEFKFLVADDGTKVVMEVPEHRNG